MRISNNEMVSFSDKEEEIDILNQIFSGFRVKQDHDLTKQWILSYNKNYQDFLDMVAEIAMVQNIIFLGQEQIFIMGVIKNQSFIHKINNCSVEIAKLIVILIQGLKNSFKAKKHPHLQKEKVIELFNQVQYLFSSNIDYDFSYDRNVKVKLKFE